MHKKLLLVFLILVLASLGSTWGQTGRMTINYDLSKRPPLDQELNIAFTPKGITSFKNEEDALFFSIPLTVEIPDLQPFWACDFKGTFQHFDSGSVSIFIRFGSSAADLGDFQEVEAYHHFELNDSLFQSEMLFVDPGKRVMQFLIVLHPLIPGQLKPIATKMRFDIFVPGPLDPVNTPTNPLKSQLLGVNPSCGCDVPAYVSRTSWGAPPGQDYSTNPNLNPSYSTVSHLVVHHSAGSNTSTDWPATVLSIWNFHVNSRGWDDIGYNWLIDPNGMIYEGRGGGNNVVGAHFCSKNTGTMGVCMLGTYENTAPTQAALNSLHQILAWKMCDANLDGMDTTLLGNTGLNLPVISGHMDGCATLCPGAMLYQNLPVVRQQAIAAQNSCVASLAGLEEGQGMKIYPNPSNGSLSLEWWQPQTAMTTFRVLDSRGRVVFSKKNFFPVGQQGCSYELPSLPEGMYWVELGSAYGIQSEKLVIIK